MDNNQNNDQTFLLELTADVVSSYVGHNPIAASDIPSLIRDIHSTLGSIGSNEAEAEPAEKQKPAVSIRKSLGRDHLICLEDGKKFKSLKRHLMTHYGLTPEAYREKWGLPSDYPMVAPAYAEERSRLAKEMGLGQKKRGS